jgi:hypothetical protein
MHTALNRPGARRAILAAIVIIQSIVGAWGYAAETIKPSLDVRDMRVLVSYVSVNELLILQRKHGANVDLRDLRQDHRDGFSILRTNRETGFRTCEIYLPAAQRPRVRDDQGTLTLGHELLHCMLGAYHR